MMGPCRACGATYWNGNCAVCVEEYKSGKAEMDEWDMLKELGCCLLVYGNPEDEQPTSCCRINIPPTSTPQSAIRAAYRAYKEKV